MWGIVPGGVGGRIKPLALSNETASCREGDRPRTVSEHLVARMMAAGVTRVCFVISPGATDLLEIHDALPGGVPAAYVIEPRPLGLCSAIFRALPLIRAEEQVVVGAPDALWFPAHALRLLGDGGLSFLCFPVSEPERFEAVVAGDDGEVREIRVADRDPRSRWIWGAMRLDGATLRALHDLWLERGREDVHVGALVNAWLERGGSARAVRAGEVYVDVSTASGMAEARRLLGART
jgi:glucose-1-phosphate thymidylyltransferase